MKRPLWHKTPVRTGDSLSFGERAADELKRGFGSWAFLISLNAIIILWVLLNTVILHSAIDPFPFILLNLGLSWLAAQQGGALQIAANRGDRISSELAVHTYENGKELLNINKQVLTINQRQLEILDRFKFLEAKLNEISEDDELKSRPS